MTETYKKLGSIAPTDDSEYVLYATPASTQSLISNITVTNRSSSSAIFDINLYNKDVGSQNSILSMKNFVAIPFYSSNTVISSRNGITWVTSTLPVSSIWAGVSYGNNTFVAVTNNTAAATSTDGITWTARTIPLGRDLRSIVYGNNIFVSITLESATGTAISHSSTDGISWTTNTVGGGGLWYDIDYGNNLFVAVAPDFNRTVNSTDGITWVRGTLAQSGVIRVKYGNGIFVSLSSYAGVSTSTNGITWTVRTISTSGQAISYGNNTFVVLSYGGTAAATSTDGITWAARTVPAYNWTRIEFGDNIFVAISNSSTTSATSTNGITWTLGTAFVSNTWGDLSYGENTNITSPTLNNLYKTSAIGANETLILEPGISLSASNSVVVKDNSSGNLTFSAYGVELS